MKKIKIMKKVFKAMSKIHESPLYDFFIDCQAELKEENVLDSAEMLKWVVAQYEKGKRDFWVVSKSCRIIPPKHGPEIIFLSKGRPELFSSQAEAYSLTFLERLGKCDYQMGRWITDSQPSLTGRDDARIYHETISDKEILLMLTNNDEYLAEKVAKIVDPNLFEIKRSDCEHEGFVTQMIGFWGGNNPSLRPVFADDSFRFLVRKR